MATEKLDLRKNFDLRAESFKEGMLLLIKHLDEQDWKPGNKFTARSDLISKKIETFYKKFKNDLANENTISFKIANVHFTNLIAAYISILDYHTTLKNQFIALCEAERYSVWLKGRRPFETPMTFPSGKEGNNSREIKICLSEKPINVLFPEYAADTCEFNSSNGWQRSIIKNEIIEKLQEENQESIVYTIPSSLRNIPGLANASFHEIKINDKQVLSYFRHATQLPIDLLGKKEAEDQYFRLTCSNLAYQIKGSIERYQDKTGFTREIIILIQSLVSPGEAASFKAKFISVPSDNDTQIYELKEKAVRLFQYALANPKKKIDDDKIKKIFFVEKECEKALFYKDLLDKWGLNIQHNIFQNPPITFTLLSTNHPLNTLRHFLKPINPRLKGMRKIQHYY